MEIRVGDELALRPIGGSIQIDRRVVGDAARLGQDRLRHFDQATKRQQTRRARQPVQAARSRGWTREELYGRGRAR